MMYDEIVNQLYALWLKYRLTLEILHNFRDFIDV